MRELMLALVLSSISDCDRFPQNWSLSDQHVRYLREEARFYYYLANITCGPSEKQWHLQRAEYTQWRAEVWDASSWAVYHKHRHEYGCCLGRLKQLRFLLGEEAYKYGIMPDTTPLIQPYTNQPLSWLRDHPPS